MSNYGETKWDIFSSKFKEKTNTLHVYVIVVREKDAMTAERKISETEVDIKNPYIHIKKCFVSGDEQRLLEFYNNRIDKFNATTHIRHFEYIVHIFVNIHELLICQIAGN